MDRFAENHKRWLFRGKRCPEWELETSLERASRRCDVDEGKYEGAVVREFRRHAYSYLSHVPKDTDTRMAGVDATLRRANPAPGFYLFFLDCAFLRV
ncbi:MAG: hypothetical protein DME93_09490 [Verrucomicrobia bacterium]|nr:MAG: hypothetical protein DME93_09490 [Verrucomicrobiota bacterium]